MKPILLVGAVPPPYHGQAVITKMVFDAEFDGFCIERLNLQFSENMDAVGGLKWKKLIVLCQGIIGLLSYWFRHIGKNPALYYCAGSAHWVPLVKDVILLGIVGRLYRKRIVHYHSGGLPEWFEHNKIAALLGHIAYGGVTKALALTHAVRVPCFSKTKLCIVPNGLDVNGDIEVNKSDFEGITFLYVGSLRESKGIGIIIEAAKELKKRDLKQDWRIRLVGDWASKEEQTKWSDKVSTFKLDSHISFPGRLTGDSKWNTFANADAFLFPSFYESENQPLVILEAMAMRLPIIASAWRGIPEIIIDNESGIIIQPRNSKALAGAMSRVMMQPELLTKFAESARGIYEKQYTRTKFIKRMKEIFNICAVK